MVTKSDLAPCGMFAAALVASFVAGPAATLAAESIPPAFATDIAPIIYQNCVECHRPAGAAPFPLTDYESVRKRARQISEVTASGFMPPWLPDTAYGPELEHARGLTPVEVGLLQRWFEAGAPEGDAARTPPTPTFASGWLLGEPDLIVELAEPYAVPAEGGDIIRNFVIPIPVAITTTVRAIDIQGGNTRVLHHAFLQLDWTSASRNRDDADPSPGFDGMDISDGINPDGHFLGWTPGARPYESHPGTEWEIEPGTDLVLQLHLLPSGKEETIQPRIGIYFSPSPPTRKPFSLLLKAKDIDIGPGDSAYRVERRFTTPLPLELVRLYPHAHYLGRSFELFAILPEGGQLPLLHIPEWDFNWQGDYRFKQPVPLPAGSTLVMTWIFDNSNDNPRNPSVPAKRVRFGPGSFDEMAEVAIQALVPEDVSRAPLQAAYASLQLCEDAGNFHAYTNLALAQAQQGAETDAAANYRKAIQLQPRYAPALNNLGVLLARRGEYDRARGLFDEAVEAEPDYLDALHNRASELYRIGNYSEAVRELRMVVARNPQLAESQLLLAQALRDAGDVAGALSQLAKVLPRVPHDPRLLLLAGECALLLERSGEAQVWLERAVEIDGGNLDAHYRLGLSHLQAGAAAAAAEAFERLLGLAPTHGLAHMRMGQIRSRQERQREAVTHFAAAWQESDSRQRNVLLAGLVHYRDLGALALALIRLGEYQHARDAFAQAVARARAAGDVAYVRDLEAKDGDLPVER